MGVLGHNRRALSGILSFPVTLEWLCGLKIRSAEPQSTSR